MSRFPTLPTMIVFNQPPLSRNPPPLFLRMGKPMIQYHLILMKRKSSGVFSRKKYSFPSNIHHLLMTESYVLNNLKNLTAHSWLENFEVSLDEAKSCIADDGTKLKINWMEWIFGFMLEISQDPGGNTSLLYGMIVTRIIKSMGVDVSSLPAKEIFSTYNDQSFSSMGYDLDEGV
ncbi:hypothetical protein HAX54_001417 [Datura stramonium]|uniref:Uncharacterized protein n=1 Tax=Datura stramonium TaxID=4076 RepID=A0ABS8T3I1_DATST|nr:hypothetical protein [Datura stramonium]